MHPHLEQIVSEIPFVITHCQIGRLTGGLIAPRTMANLDSLGQGPKQRIKFGRKVAYPRAAFLAWFEERMEVEDV